MNGGICCLNKEKVIYFCLMLVIFLIRIQNIADLSGPFIFYDEAGYWGHAANLAGLPWKEVVESWYSYGYSILLIPLFWISHDMAVLYRMAIILNAIMGVLAFILGNAVILQIDEKCNHIISMLISLTATCYSAYLFHSDIAWAETFIYTWFMLIVWSMGRFCKKNTWHNLILLTLEIAFIYIIHNRCIVIFIAHVITLFCMLMFKKMNRKKICVVILILSTAYLLNSLIKVGFSFLEWGQSDGFSGNDIASQYNNLKLLFNLNGWLVLLKSLAGKIWYILTSTIMFAYLGMVFIIKKGIYYIRKREISEGNDLLFFYIFLGLFSCFTISVATISMHSIDFTQPIPRIDFAFYGRYHEILCGILIILGLLNVYESGKQKNVLIVNLLGLIIYLVCSGLLYQQIDGIDQYIINIVCVPGIYFLKDFSYIEYCTIVVGIYFIITLLCFFRHRKIKLCIVSLFLILIFGNVYRNAYGQCTKALQEGREKVVKGLNKILNTNKQYITYQLSNGAVSKCSVRTRVVDNVIKYRLPASTEENYFLLLDAGNEPPLELLKQNIYFVDYENCYYELFAVGNELIEALHSEGYLCNKIDRVEASFSDMADIQMQFTDDSQGKKVQLGNELQIIVSIYNDSGVYVINQTGYQLSYHIYNELGELVLWDGERYPISGFAMEKRIPVTIDTKQLGKAGKYIIEIDIIGKEWLSLVGGKTIKLSVIVEN